MARSAAMLVGGASPDGLDYLLGAPAEEVALTAQLDAAARSARASFRVQAIGVGRRAEGVRSTEKWSYPTEALLAGLSVNSTPLCFTGGSIGSEAVFTFGTWRDDGDTALADDDANVIAQLLGAPYRSVETAPAAPGSEAQPFG